MNPRPLLKHFPELSQLPQERQEALLLQAHELATGPDRRLETWRNNILALAAVSAVCLLLTFWLAPALGLSAAMSGVLIMVVILPAFVYIQQRRYIARLRPEVEKLVGHRNSTP